MLTPRPVVECWLAVRRTVPDLPRLSTPLLVRDLPRLRTPLLLPARLRALSACVDAATGSGLLCGGQCWTCRGLRRRTRQAGRQAGPATEAAAGSAATGRCQACGRLAPAEGGGRQARGRPLLPLLPLPGLRASQGRDKALPEALLRCFEPRRRLPKALLLLRCFERRRLPKALLLPKGGGCAAGSACCNCERRLLLLRAKAAAAAAAAAAAKAAALLCCCSCAAAALVLLLCCCCCCCQGCCCCCSQARCRRRICPGAAAWRPSPWPSPQSPPPR